MSGEQDSKANGAAGEWRFEPSPFAQDWGLLWFDDQPNSYAVEILKEQGLRIIVDHQAAARVPALERALEVAERYIHLLGQTYSADEFIKAKREARAAWLEAWADQFPSDASKAAVSNDDFYRSRAALNSTTAGSEPARGGQG